MSGTTTFTWVGGQDIDGPNNWLTPLNWIIGAAPATKFPNAATDAVVVNLDDGTKDAIISGGQSITIGSLSIGNPTTPVAGLQGGHVLVGGSPLPTGIGGGGGGTLTVLNGISITSTNTGGSLVGGNNGVIITPTMIVNGGPDDLIGGGGTFDIGHPRQS